MGCSQTEWVNIIRMLSFIVIGRNEGWKLTLCFQSIHKCIIGNNLSDYEINYVDSNSSDDSIDRAKKYKDVKIFKLTGVCNAAIARNIGAKESKGDVLFFIDGDMEIIADFLPLVYNEKEGLMHDFVSGQFVNYYYDEDNNYLYNKEYYFFKNKENRYDVVTGGLFVIKKDVWNSVGGMKNKFRISEDLDFGLRLAQKKILLLRKREVLAKHNTIYYKNKNRMCGDLLRGNYLYRGVLYREHFFNFRIYPMILRNEYSMLMLLLSIFIFAFWGSYFFYIIYIIFLMGRALIVSYTKFKDLLSRVIYYLIRDISIIISFFLFFPKIKKTISYEKITNNLI